MVAVERLKDDALVTGIQQGHESCVQCSGGTGGHEHLGFRIDRQSIEGRELLRDGVPKRSDAVEARVNVLALRDGIERSPRYRGRDVGVTDALCEVDAVHLRARDGHSSDL